MFEIEGLLAIHKPPNPVSKNINAQFRAHNGPYFPVNETNVAHGRFSLQFAFYFSDMQSSTKMLLDIQITFMIYKYMLLFMLYERLWQLSCLQLITTEQHSNGHSNSPVTKSCL